MLSADVAQNVNEFTAPGRGEAFWRHEDVTPDRRTDVETITFKFRTVVWIVGGCVSLFLSIAGAFWMATSGLRSDMRDVLTRMTMQAEIDKVNQKLQDERAAFMTRAVQEIKAQQTMQDLKFEHFKETVLTNGRLKP